MLSAKGRFRPARSGLRTLTLVLAFIGLGVSGCADGFAALSAAPSPLELVAAAVRNDAVRLTWIPVDQDNVVSYVIERRTALKGPFAEVAQVPQTNLAQVIWIDSDVAPDTYYGYRVIAVTSVGDRSSPSVVGGALTPPLPGIEIATSSLVTAAESVDPDGYEVMIAGPDTVRAALGVQATRRFSPLRPGRYAVTLSGVVNRCAVNGASTLEVVVTDTTATTITPVQFQITCRDPSRGEIAVNVALSGDSLDNAFTIDVLGAIADSTLPVTERVYSARRDLESTSPSTRLTNLRPGIYDVKLEGLANNCTLEGAATRKVTVTPLSLGDVGFSVACKGSSQPVSTAPFVWRNRWTPKPAATGDTVVLESTLDLTQQATRTVSGVEATLYYDPAVLRFEEEVAGQLPRLTANGLVPGEIAFNAISAGSPRTGVVSLAKFKFVVIGASGTRSISRSQFIKAGSPPFQDSIRVVEDTLVVGAGGGAQNVRPTAQFTGPTTGTVGTGVTFNGSTSSDPDGTIASYAWTFGDNTTAVVASPSKTYTAAGTYTVTLTVTDNRGATATRTASITITGGTTPPPAGNAPVARANGPYTVQVGVPLTLSSAGSANATSFSWALGNGQTATGASPSVTYATAGTFTAVLSVTSANGATSTDQATVIVTAAPPPPPPPSNATPLVWKNVVQPYDLVAKTVELRLVYDLSANVPETPGAEALRSFVIDSLKWDPTRLVLSSISSGSGINFEGTISQPGAASGRISLRGTTSAGIDGGANLVIASIVFRVIGTPGQTTTTSTFLGPLIGTSATNSFSYDAKTTIVEGQFVLP